MTEVPDPAPAGAPRVEMRGVGKRYSQLEDRAMLLKSIVPFMSPTKRERWAVRGLDLSLMDGETVGVLGRNGAGKTTLLRMLAGVTRPTEGTVTIRGRVAPLISVGVGFHQEMSGRENVFVNGMLLGLTKTEVKERLDEIVGFAELADYIHTPVKFYSSGMFMRLGFSVACHVDPDILLVDEVLAVGDSAFQVKCIRRMKAMQERGTTILIVSHSMGAIRLLCPRSILISKGNMVFDGPTEETIARHGELMSAPEGPDDAMGSGSTAVTILERVVEGPAGPTHNPKRGEPLVYRARVRFNRTVDTPQYFIEVMFEQGSSVYAIFTNAERRSETVEAGAEVLIEAAFNAHLGSGTHHVSLRVCSRDFREDLASDGVGYALFVDPLLGTSGVADLEGSLRINGMEADRLSSFMLGGSRERLEDALG